MCSHVIEKEPEVEREGDRKGVKYQEIIGNVNNTETMGNIRYMKVIFMYLRFSHIYDF